MGFGGVSVWQLVIVLLIVIVIFGTKKLRNMGGDLGSAVKNFKSSVKEEASDDVADAENAVIEKAEAAKETVEEAVVDTVVDTAAETTEKKDA